MRAEANSPGLGVPKDRKAIGNEFLLEVELNQLSCILEQSAQSKVFWPGQV